MPRQELIYSPNLHRYPLAHATTGLDLLPNLHRYPLAHATTGISSALFNTKKGTKTSDSYVLLSLPQIATLLSLPQILSLFPYILSTCYSDIKTSNFDRVVKLKKQRFVNLSFRQAVQIDSSPIDSNVEL